MIQRIMSGSQQISSLIQLLCEKSKGQKINSIIWKYNQMLTNIMFQTSKKNYLSILIDQRPKDSITY